LQSDAGCWLLLEVAMYNACSRKGMVLPLSLFAIVAVIGLVATMSGLNQGVKTQIYRTNNHQLSFLIAYSAFSRVCAKIHSFSWATRPFLNEPYTETKVPFQGGHYDLLVENTSGKPLQADVYIRTHLAGFSRMYFWRIRVNEDLFDISNNIIVEMYTTAEPDDFPSVNGARVIAGKVENMLAERAANQKKSDQLTSELIKINNPVSILEKIGARVPEDFQNDWPIPPSEEAMSSRSPVTIAGIEPQPAGEKPGASGPGPVSPASGNSGSDNNSTNPAVAQDSMTGNNINALAQQIANSSEQMVTSSANAWNEVDAAGGHSDAAAAQDHFEQAGTAKEETMEALDDLIAESKAGIEEAPSPAAREAMEERVAQTVAAAMKNITTSLAPALDHLLNNYSGYLSSISTAEAAEDVLSDWQASENGAQADLDKLSSMKSSVSGYSMSPEIRQTMEDAVVAAQERLAATKAAVAAAEARVAELKALEAQANSADDPAPEEQQETPAW